MNNKNNQSEQKLRGGYYTPSSIGQYLWEWVNEINPKNLLEPSAGIGSLINEVQTDNELEVTAIELLKSEANKIKQPSKNVAVNIHIGDYFKWDSIHLNEQFDGILSNPPYIRFQFLTEEQRINQSRILIENDLKPNKLINSWVSFVVSSVSHLRAGGHIGLVIPTDLLQVNYAKQVREFLAKEMSKLYIVTFEKNLFPDTQQNFLLILGCKRKEKSTEENVDFKHIEAVDAGHIPNWNAVNSTDIPSLSLDKWTSLLIKEIDRSYVENTLNTGIPFSNVAKVEVGITTGNNKLFSLSYSQVNEINAENVVMPLLGKSSSSKGIFFNSDELLRLNKLNKGSYLLTINEKNKYDISTKLKNYLQTAVDSGETNGYKLSIRDYWYQIPSVWVPDAFILRRMGQIPKLILNEVNGVSTDTFHRVKFKKSVNSNLVLFAFYSSITRLSFELSGRTFGGGALEILPGDIKNIKLPPIDYFDQSDKYSLELTKLNEMIKAGKYLETTQYVDSVLSYKFGVNYDFNRLQSILSRTINLRTT